MSRGKKATVSLPRLGEVLKLSSLEVRSLVHSRKVVVLDRRVHSVRRADAIRLIQWKKTSGLRHAGKTLHVHEPMVRRFLDQGRLRGVELWGRIRIFNTSISRLLREGVFGSDIAHPDQRGVARFSKQRLHEVSSKAGCANREKERARKARAEEARLKELAEQQKRKISTVLKAIFVPKTRAEKQQVGTKRMVTPLVAAEFLGVPLKELERLYNGGAIRWESVDGQALLYASSVEGRKLRQLSVQKPRISRKE